MEKSIRLERKMLQVNLFNTVIVFLIIFLEIDHQNLNVFSFCPNLEKFKGFFLINDEKAGLLLRKMMFEFVKNATKEYAKLRYEDFLAESRRKLDLIQQNFIDTLNLNPLESPILDYEF